MGIPEFDLDKVNLTALNIDCELSERRTTHCRHRQKQEDKTANILLIKYLIGFCICSLVWAVFVLLCSCKGELKINLSSHPINE